MSSGIYTITAPSGNQYVGSAIDISARWARHRHDLRFAKHPNKALQRAWGKYGESDLKFAILLICAKSDLLMYEQRAIDILNPEYNALRIAGSSIGFTHDAETRAKMSEKAKGKILNQNQLDALAAGRAASQQPEIRKRMAEKVSIALTGRPRSESHRQSLSNALKGKPNGRKGIPMSDAQKLKISISSTGKKLSDEHKANISKGLAGHVITPEVRKRMSAPLIGRPLSEEHKAKMHAAGIMFQKGQTPHNLGVPHTDETKRKMKLAWELRREKAKQNDCEILEQTDRAVAE